jgi:hypothetical protein
VKLLYAKKTALVKMPKNGTYFLEVLDADGTNLQWLKFQGKDYRLPVEKLAAGVYELRVFDGNMSPIGSASFTLDADGDLYKPEPLYPANTAPSVMAAYMRDSLTLIVEVKADSLLEHNIHLPIKNFTVETGKEIPVDTLFISKNKLVFRLYKYPGKGARISHPTSQTETNWITNNHNVKILDVYKRPVYDSTSKIKTAPPPYLNLQPVANKKPVKILLKPGGTNYIEVFDDKGNKVQWLSCSGKQYIFPSKNFPKGTYTLHLFDYDINEIGTSTIVVQ